MPSPGKTVKAPGFLKLLIIMGLIEGTSTLVLGWAVIMKRVLEHPDGPMAVSVTGSIHGLLFVIFVVMLFIAKFRVPLSLGLCLAGLAGSVVPFVAFIVDIPLYRLLKSARTS